jgi:hypothetical protein
MPPLNREPLTETTCDIREEFELASIREFSHSGLSLGVGVSREGRRARIGAAILREGKAHLRWRNSVFTYANMYFQAYRQPLESSRPGDEDWAPLGSRSGQSAIYDEIDDELGDDEEALEGGGEIEA